MLSRNLLLAAKTHWLHRNDKHPLISRLQNSTFGGSERTTLNFEWLTWAFSRNRIALKNINKFWFLRISINRKQPFRCLTNISADFSGDIYLNSMHHHFANHWKSILQFFYITIPVEKIQMYTFILASFRSRQINWIFVKKLTAGQFHRKMPWTGVVSSFPRCSTICQSDWPIAQKNAYFERLFTFLLIHFQIHYKSYCKKLEPRFSDFT